MSEINEICLLSEYKIDEKDKDMKSKIEEVDQLEKDKKYYLAVYKLESLILQDGTTEKFNYRFLNLILDHYNEIFKEINNFSKGIQLNEELQIKYEDAINDANKYNFYYFRDCFDKYEVTLNQTQLNKITSKKKIHNLKVINKFTLLKEEYLKLIEDITSEDKIVSAQTIYETIYNLNSKIKDENESKLFYIYKYLDINLINNNRIFELIQNNKFYLSQFSFGFFNNLGIPIGYSDNLNLKFRYLFLLIKNKINKLEKKKKKTTQNNSIEEKTDSSIKFVFKTFKDIFSNIKEERLEFIKYFSLIFLYIIFEGKYNITDIYNEETKLPFSYFKILCEQFSMNNNVDDNQKFLYKKLKILQSTDKQIIINYNAQELCLNFEDYSINSFLINSTKKSNDILIKNNSKKFLCKDKIYEEYYDDFIELLKKICCSNTVKILQSLHNEFKLSNAFFSNAEIKNDFFENRLKFYPYESYKIYGITDKYLLEVYLSSIYLNNINNYDNSLDENFKEILYTFNMALNSVTFQHEALNHYVRAYLSYFGNQLERKISIDTKSADIYYPIQKLEEINYTPKYLRKYIEKLTEEDLYELSKTSELEYEKYIGEYTKEQNELNSAKNDNTELNDEGYYYERQLFTTKEEKKLTEFNFLQALMLIDEDAYNLDPIHFHYCFLQLRDTIKYSFIKENFGSELLKKLVEKIDISLVNRIKSLTFTAKRGSNDGVMYFDFSDRIGYDVMSSYANE